MRFHSETYTDCGFRNHPEKLNQKIKYKKILQARFGALPSPRAQSRFGGSSSSGASLRGSLTVECVLLLPLFFLGICTMICFLDFYQVQTEKLSKLCQTAREMGMYAYVTETENDIEVPSVYTYRFPVSIVPLPPVVMTNHVRVHPWTGYRGSNENIEAEEMVYVTETGSVYHLSADCTYLDLSIRQKDGSEVGSLRNRYGERYHACESCSEGAPPGSIVYVTDSGNRYHNSASCSRLKRTVRLIKKSEAGSRHACSRCGSND